MRTAGAGSLQMRVNTENAAYVQGRLIETGFCLFDILRRDFRLEGRSLLLFVFAEGFDILAGENRFDKPETMCYNLVTTSEFPLKLHVED